MTFSRVTIGETATAGTNLPAVNPSRAAAQIVANRRNPGRLIRARYEAAEDTADNRRLWKAADALSADGVANPHVRRQLRNRVRLAERNNPTLQGIADTVAFEIVGTGPQLQMLVDTEAASTEIENDFIAWARREGLAEKLRLIIKTEDVSGEAFIVQQQNSRGDLTYGVYEPDHVQGTLVSQSSETYYDGIHYNAYGEPSAYDITYSHPGDSAIGYLGQNDFRTIDSDFVFHYFTPRRPGQRRGVPAYASAVEPLEERRRYRHATLGAAETAASIASVIEQDKDLRDIVNGEPVPNAPAEPMEQIELDHRTATVLAPGQKLSQVKAEQPTTAYDSFANALLKEAARGVNMPYILAALDSSASNLAAAYLDLQTWRKAVAVRRDKMAGLLDWMFQTWRRWYGYGSEPIAAGATHAWRWPSLAQHADPSKNAAADAANLKSGADTIPAIFSRKGEDWKKAQEAEAEELGITVQELRKRKLDARYPSPGAPGSQVAKPKQGSTPPGEDEQDNTDGEEN